MYVGDIEFVLMRPSAVCREKDNTINLEDVANFSTLKQGRAFYKLHSIITVADAQTLGTCNAIALFNFKILFPSLLTEMCSEIV